jgi:hypothetical protein
MMVIWIAPRLRTIFIEAGEQAAIAAVPKIPRTADEQ